MNRALAPSIHTPLHLPSIGMKKALLKNGVPVYYIENEEELVKISLFFASGSLYEDQQGLAAALAQLLLSGTSRLNAFEIQEQLDLWGAYTEVENSYEHCTVNIFCLKPYAKAILPFLCEVLQDIRIPEKEFVLYQERSIENLKVNQQKTAFIAKRSLVKNLYGEAHPYGKSMGLIQYERLTLDRIETFYKEVFVSSLEYVVLSTPLDEKDIAVLSGFPRGTTKRPLVASSESVPETRTNIHKDDAVQASLALGMECIGRQSPEYPAWALLITLFGGYFGSRLMKNIREDKGYTYGIHSGVQHLPDRSYLSIRSDVKNDAKEACLEEIFKEIKRLKEEHIEEEELVVVKNYLLGSVQRSFDGSIALCDRFRTIYDNELPLDYYQSYIQAINQADSQLLYTLANKYLDTSDIYVVVAGNFST